jgi:hypothetical protein
MNDPEIVKIWGEPLRGDGRTDLRGDGGGKVAENDSNVPEKWGCGFEPGRADPRGKIIVPRRE